MTLSWLHPNAFRYFNQPEELAFARAGGGVRTSWSGMGPPCSKYRFFFRLITTRPFLAVVFARTRTPFLARPFCIHHNIVSPGMSQRLSQGLCHVSTVHEARVRGATAEASTNRACSGETRAQSAARYRVAWMLRHPPCGPALPCKSSVTYSRPSPQLE
jgi:hypothetical protein